MTAIRKAKKGLSRRTFLKATAGGLAAGSGAITGFPTIWAQALKDVTILQVGPAYSVFQDIANQASKDLGFKIEIQNAWTDALMTRIVNQAETVDIADLEFWGMNARCTIFHRIAGSLSTCATYGAKSAGSAAR